VSGQPSRCLRLGPPTPTRLTSLNARRASRYRWPFVCRSTSRQNEAGRPFLPSRSCGTSAPSVKNLSSASGAMCAVPPAAPDAAANKKQNHLTRRTKSEILLLYRGGLCHQFFPQQNRRAFLSAAALHSPQLLSFLFALIVAQTHGLWSLPRSRVRTVSFRTMASRIALRPPRSPYRGTRLPLAANHSAICRISGRMLLLL